MNPSALLFDFGGTLAYIYPRHEWLYLRACREFGLEARAELIPLLEDSGWDAYQTPQGPAHPTVSVSQEAFRRFKTALLAQRLAAMGVSGPREAVAARVLELDTQPEMHQLFDDVLSTLAALKERGYPMAIISNHEWELPDLVAGLGLAEFFDAVVTSARVGYRKPHPRIYQQALAELGIQPAAALMVGDSLESDIAGAVRIGMQAVLLDRRGNHRADSLEIPVVPSLSALLRLL